MEKFTLRIGFSMGIPALRGEVGGPDRIALFLFG